MKLYCNTMFYIVAGKGCKRQNCIAIQNGIATERLGSWAGAGRAGVGAGALARQGAAGRSRRAAWELDARPGVLLGWPKAVHTVHSACFWPDLTRYFS